MVFCLLIDEGWGEQAMRRTADFGAPTAYLSPPPVPYTGSSGSARALRHEPSIGLVNGGSPHSSSSPGPASWGGPALLSGVDSAPAWSVAARVLRRRAEPQRTLIDGLKP